MIVGSDSSELRSLPPRARRDEVAQRSHELVEASCGRHRGWPARSSRRRAARWRRRGGRAAAGRNAAVEPEAVELGHLARRAGAAAFSSSAAGSRRSRDRTRWRCRSLEPGEGAAHVDRASRGSSGGSRASNAPSAPRSPGASRPGASARPGGGAGGLARGGRRRRRRRRYAAAARSTSAGDRASGPVPSTPARSTPSARRPPRQRENGAGAPARSRGRGGAAGAARAGGARGGARRGAGGATFAPPAHGRERRADRHLVALVDQQLTRSRPSSKISISMSALSVSTTATMSPRLHRVAGLDVPFEQRAGVHVGAERRHPELSHRPHHRWPPPTIVLGLGQRRLLEVLRVGHRHLGAADPARPALELVEGLLHDPGADLRGRGRRCASPRRR